MPYINVVLKNGTSVPVDDANTAQWERELLFEGAPSNAVVERLICRHGDQVVARFNAADVSGYTWHDGRR